MPTTQQSTATTATAAPAAAHAAQAEQKPITDAARADAVTLIVGALAVFLSQMRKRDQGWLQQTLASRADASVTRDEVAELVAEEDQRGREFAELSAKRTAADLGSVLAIPDERQRTAAVHGILSRERRYARMRSEAMAARAVAALERVELKKASPQGAFWKLDPHVKEHTVGCLVMGGKFWPWLVLDRVHPPRHPGCPCRLKSYGAAVADGDMSPGAVANVADAVKSASGVVMEASVADQIANELELREQLARSGFVDAVKLAAIPLAVS